MIKKKYKALFIMAMQDSMAYRFTYFMGILSTFVSILTIFYVWKGIFAGRDILNGYTWVEMKTYLYVMFIINTFISWYSEGKISRSIMNGSIAMDLLKPIDFQKMQLSQSMGSCIMEGFISIAFSSVFVIAFGGISLPNNVQTYIFFIISVLASFFVKFSIVYIFALLCFWTTNSLGIRWVRGAITNLFSGALIPISFFPSWLLATAKVLPFQCIIYIPASIFTETAGSTTQIIQLILLQLFWAIALWYTSKRIWKHAIKKVTIHGG